MGILRCRLRVSSGRFSGALFLGLVPLVPFLVAGTLLLVHWRHGPFLYGDGALLEISTRAALRGEQLLGPYSRFGFSHPGPSYFYLLAPLYWATGGSTNSLILSAVLINAASVALTMFLLHRLVDRWAYVFATVMVAQYVSYLDTHIADPWNPRVTILPFMLSVCCFAAVAAGWRSVLPLALFVSSFVVQTHIAYLPAVIVMGGAVLVLSLVPRLRAIVGRGDLCASRSTRIAVVSALVLALLWLPPLLDQLAHRDGNLGALLAFFEHNRGTYTLGEAATASAVVLSDFFLSFFQGARAVWTQGAAPYLWQMAAPLQLALLLVGTFCARRAKNDFLVVLSVLCLLLSGTAIWTVKGIIGTIHDYLVLWMTGIGMLTWVAIGGGAVAYFTSRQRPTVGRRVKWACLVAAAAFIAASVSRSIVTLLGSPAAADVPGEDEWRNPQEMRSLAAQVVEFAARRRNGDLLLRYVDEEAWMPAAALVNELDRHGVGAKVDGPWASRFPRRFRLESLTQSELVVVASRTTPLLLASRPAEAIAAGQHFTVLRLSLDGSLSGTLSLCALPAFALEYSGFSQCHRSEGGTFYRWSSAGVSSMSIRLKPGHEHLLTLSLFPYEVEDQRQRVGVFFNAEEVGLLELQPGREWREYAIRLPVALVRETNEIVFRYSSTHRRRDASRSAAVDPLAVAFRDLTIVPLQ